MTSDVRHATRAPDERPPTTSATSPATSDSDPLEHRDPGGVEHVCGGGAATARDAVRLLHESDAHPLRERSLGGRNQIARRHAAPGSMAEHEPGTLLVRAAHMDSRGAVRRVDVEHHLGVCRRAMSSGRWPRLMLVIETKGMHR